MSNYNKIILMGNVTRDPELKYLPNGNPVIEIGLAVSRRWNDKQTGEKREATTFVECKCFGRGAEVIDKYVNKGDPLFLDGRLEFRTWEDKSTGGRRSKHEVLIENFELMGQRDRGEQRASGQQQQQQQQRQPAADPYQGEDVPF